MIYDLYFYSCRVMKMSLTIIDFFFNNGQIILHDFYSELGKYMIGIMQS